MNFFSFLLACLCFPYKKASTPDSKWPLRAARTRSLAAPGGCYHIALGTPLFRFSLQGAVATLASLGPFSLVEGSDPFLLLAGTSYHHLPNEPGVVLAF